MTHPQILFHSVTFNLPTGKTLFHEIDLAFLKRKTGLVGRNGIGKSTILKLILNQLQPHAGSIQIVGSIEYVPQDVSSMLELSVAGLLGCEDKIHALLRISQGSIDVEDFATLNEEWDIEDKVKQQLNAFGLKTISLNQSIQHLSGGEITRLLLSKAFFSNADFLLLDEPTNHLDATAREQLYLAIQQWQGGLIIVSHDRNLLNLMEEIVELTSLGVATYGGNYDHYAEQKIIEEAATAQEMQDAEKQMDKTKKSIQFSREKHAQMQSYGRELRRSGSIDKLGANSKKGKSERSQAKMLIKEERLLHEAETKLQIAKEKLELVETITVDLPETRVPMGKVILEMEDVVFSYVPEAKLIRNVNLKMQGPERLALVGDNGSGKTTLIKLILGELQPESGSIYVGTDYVIYLDQNTCLLNPNESLLENFMRLNPDANENDAYRSLAKFLFKNTAALQLTRHLSGGERLRALLACVLLAKHPPQLLILDEPTNHLDIASIERIESALKNYQGAMIVISHDKSFLKNIGAEKLVQLGA